MHCQFSFLFQVQYTLAGPYPVPTPIDNRETQTELGLGLCKDDNEGNKFFTPSELIYFPHASFHTMIYLPLDICFSRWLLGSVRSFVRSIIQKRPCVFNPQVRNSCASAGRNVIVGFVLDVGRPSHSEASKHRGALSTRRMDRS